MVKTHKLSMRAHESLPDIFPTLMEPPEQCMLENGLLSIREEAVAKNTTVVVCFLHRY